VGTGMTIAGGRHDLVVDHRRRLLAQSIVDDLPQPFLPNVGVVPEEFQRLRVEWFHRGCLAGCGQSSS